MAISLEYTYVVVIAGTALLGLVGGAMGTFVFLQGHSLVTDAISHAALPGIAFMFLCTHTRNSLLLLLGAGLASFLGSLLIEWVLAYSKLKHDSVLGVVLSVFFGLGTVLVSIIQKRSLTEQGIVTKFLLGNAATLVKLDVILMAAIAMVVIGVLAIGWRFCRLFLFDPLFAQSLGYSISYGYFCVRILTVATILIGLQTVGVILMSSFFIIPAVAARQFTNNLGVMMILSGLCGMTAGMSGGVASCAIKHLPTGPITVVILSIMLLLSYGYKGLLAIAMKMGWKVMVNDD